MDLYKRLEGLACCQGQVMVDAAELKALLVDFHSLLWQKRELNDSMQALWKKNAELEEQVKKLESDKSDLECQIHWVEQNLEEAENELYYAERRLEGSLP